MRRPYLYKDFQRFLGLSVSCFITSDDWVFTAEPPKKTVPSRYTARHLSKVAQVSPCLYVKVAKMCRRYGFIGLRQP